MKTFFDKSWSSLNAWFPASDLVPWSSDQMQRDFDTCASTSEEKWPQEDVMFGDWIVDCVQYRPGIAPDFVIFGKTGPYRSQIFFMHVTNQKQKTGLLSRIEGPAELIESLLLPAQQQDIDCKLVFVMNAGFNQGETLHLAGYRFDAIEGGIALGLPKNSYLQVAA